MTDTTRCWDGLSKPRRTVAAVVVALLLAAPVFAETARLDDLRRQALASETKGEWLEACRSYDEMIRKDRTNVAAREGYHRCYRQYQIVRRHKDRIYRDALASLQPAQALDIYESVLTTISLTYVERNKTDVNFLFKHGVQELQYALQQDVFVREHLPTARPAALEAFRDRLTHWPARKIGNRFEVRSLILTLAGMAQQEGLVPNKAAFAVVLAFEFAFGACTGLDEYTLFLTPNHYNAMQAALRGKLAGIGVDLATIDDKLAIARVYPKSPASQFDPPLQEGDRVLRIDNQNVEHLPAEVAAELLRGDIGSKVVVEIAGPGMMMSRQVELERRPVVIPSVDPPTLDENYIGYLRITHFQDTTVQEVKEALAELQTLGMKGLILDLRGNPGGSFPAAVKVAELFLPEGVIVNTTSQFKEYSKPYKVENNPNPLTTPMRVLIDSETASSAELLAEALKENGRATLFGQTTFGKGSIQCIIPLDKTPGGLRITVAKFSSPRKNPYSGVGVSPDVIVNTLGVSPDPIRDAARQDLGAMLKGMMGMMGM